MKETRLEAYDSFFLHFKLLSRGEAFHRHTTHTDMQYHIWFVHRPLVHWYPLQLLWLPILLLPMLPMHHRRCPHPDCKTMFRLFPDMERCQSINLQPSAWFIGGMNRPRTAKWPNNSNSNSKRRARSSLLCRKADEAPTLLRRLSMSSAVFCAVAKRSRSCCESPTPMLLSAIQSSSHVTASESNCTECNSRTVRYAHCRRTALIHHNPTWSTTCTVDRKPDLERCLQDLLQPDMRQHFAGSFNR